MSEEIQKMSEEITKVTKNFNDGYGGISARLGSLTELIVVPKLRHSMNVYGHNFETTEPDTQLRGIVRGRKEDITQVDLILRGPSEILAVEIKARLKEKHVREHLERLRDLRDNEDIVHIDGKKMFGAVAGIAIDREARSVALEHGLYIVMIQEEKSNLAIEKPETGCRPY